MFVLTFKDGISRALKDKYPQGEIEVHVTMTEEYFKEFTSVWDGCYTPEKKRNT